MSSVRIPLHNRKYPNMVAIVDEVDLAVVNRHRWSAMLSCGNWYAYTKIAGKTVYLHRLLMHPSKQDVVDHINHNGLDNRRANLRICSRSLNQQNRRGVQSNNTSGFLGVVLDKRRGKWRGEVRTKGLYKTTGPFRSPDEAARARDQLALQVYGPHATLNFPDEQEAS